MNDLNRFLEAQNNTYKIALQEIKNGKKETHWMWYIFPQLKGLGLSHISEYYGIKDIKEAKEYWGHPILGKRLSEITEELLKIEHDDIKEIFYYPDNLKLHSCMTLFYLASNKHNIFKSVLNKFFDGKIDINSKIIINKGIY